jgi:hypothetical protein
VTSRTQSPERERERRKKERRKNRREGVSDRLPTKEKDDLDLETKRRVLETAKNQTTKDRERNAAHFLYDSHLVQTTPPKRKEKGAKLAIQ